MKIQFNAATKMTWVYIPIEFVRKLGLIKGDNLSFVSHDETSVLIKKENQTK